MFAAPPIVAAVFLVLAHSPGAGAVQRKILCLHGGGGTAASFRAAQGMRALMASLPNHEFVFPDGGYSGGAKGGRLWIPDPPGGKSIPTVGAECAAESFAVLDNVVDRDGPFESILGYSQGAAFVPVYLAHANPGTFRAAIMFSGYLTTTHQGLLDSVVAKAPFGGLPALVWYGERDPIIGSVLSAGQAAMFRSPLLLSSASGGHTVPASDDPTYSAVLAFMRGPGPAHPPAEPRSAASRPPLTASVAGARMLLLAHAATS